MTNFKSLAISVITVLFMVPAVFADGEIITKSPYGEYVYETTMKELINKGVSDEIKLVNKRFLLSPSYFTSSLYVVISNLKSS